MKSIELGDILSTDEYNELQDAERIIEEGYAAFLKVGLALARVRDSRLYRATHSTFEAYCESRWAISRTRAYELIGSAGITATLSAIADIPLPQNEGQARELRGLDPEVAAEVMKAAVDEDGVVTAAAIKSARKAVAPTPEKVTSRKTESETVEYTSPDSAPAVTGEVPPLADSGPAPGVEPEQESGALDPIAAAKAEAAKSPHNLAHKAIDRFRDANKTVEAAGGIDALLAETRDYAAAQNWVKDLEDSIAITETWLSALRRQHLRSV